MIIKKVIALILIFLVGFSIHIQEKKTIEINALNFAQVPYQQELGVTEAACDLPENLY